MDKILQSMSSRNGDISVTNDGATILRSIHVDNAAAKVLVDIAKTQDDEVGDGTTSVTVLCGELLREAEHLVNARLHPQTIISGWRLATEIARGVLTSMAEDNGSNEAAFRCDPFLLSTKSVLLQCSFLTLGGLSPLDLVICK
jgi:T-complex protein 1 subunit beta